MKRIVPLLIVFAVLFEACSHGESPKADTTIVTENQTENEMTTTKTRTQLAQTGDTKSVPSEYTKACPKASMSGAVNPAATPTNGLTN
ncbi:MAG: hypothetical protein E7570_08875 [Ruminococcaceae bacterium]|nr:hypothetical protein [Oscillospiraceae bacterium]